MKRPNPRTMAGILVLLPLSACSLPGVTPVRSPLVGRTDFGAERQTQATTDEIGVAATVSLIDPATNTTIATTLTSPGATFSLAIPSYIPEIQSYYLEAVKGLHQNKAGNDAARIRTVVRWTGGQWEALTVGNASINIATTALAAIANLRQASNPVDLDGLMNALRPDGAMSWGYDFTPGSSGVAHSELDAVATLVSQSLAQDVDPLTSLTYNGVSYLILAPSAYAWVSGTTPSPAIAGEPLTIRGGNFSATPGANLVSLNGLALAVNAAAPTQLDVLLPADATSGVLAVGNATVSLIVTSDLTGGVEPPPTVTVPTSNGIDVSGSVFGR